MPTFWRVFIINQCWILSKAFSASIEMIIWFFSFNLLMWCITLIDLRILKNPCIPGINPTWSWYMILLKCCWCPLHPCCCALLRGSKASPPHPTPQSLPVKGLPNVCKLFLLHSSLPEVQVPSLFFCLCFFFFLLSYPGTWWVSCLLGSLRSSASIQYVFCKSCSTCRCVSDVFVGRKVISTSYSSTILKVSLCNSLFKIDGILSEWQFFPAVLFLDFTFSGTANNLIRYWYLCTRKIF